MIVGLKTYEFLKAHGVKVEPLPPKIEGGILQFIPEGNLFDDKKSDKEIMEDFVKACDKLKESNEA
jgi:hypothetical protein